MRRSGQSQAHDPALRITAIYVVVAGLVVLVADQLMARVTRDPSLLSWLDTYSGWLVVAATAPIIYIERRRAERARRRLAATMEASQDAIVGLDAGGTVTSWNDGAEHLLGVPRTEAIGRPLWTFWRGTALSPPVPGLDPILADVRSGQVIRLEEITCTARDRQTRHMALTFSPVFDARGRVTAIALTGRDTTERWGFEQSLRQSEEQMRTITDSLPVEISAIDSRLRVRFVNEVAARAYGSTAEALVDLDFRVLIGKESMLRFAPHLEQALTGEQVAFDWERVDPRFGTRSLHTTLVPHFGPGNNVLGLYILSEDVTSRRHAERSLRMAEVGALASGFAHEVRNPLNAMQMQAALIGRRLGTADAESMALVRDQLAGLEGEIQRVQRLTEEFLAYGRPASEHADLVPVSEVVEEVASFVRPEFEALGCQVVVESGPATAAPACVWMERARLKQVLFNLAENARLAMARDDVLTLSWGEDPDGMVRIEVRDTGAGIPAAEIGRVFAAFYSTREGGSGLGLAIVRSTVEAADGRVDVESTEGEGSRFRILLPAVAALDASTPAAAVRPARPARRPPDRPGDTGA
ncbi:MAG: PAS domain-containing protein [Candidatus Eiseniibacteriota bacterium]|jgi:PAS domain S-box-containing protein